MYINITQALFRAIKPDTCTDVKNYERYSDIVYEVHGQVLIHRAHTDGAESYIMEDCEV